MKLTEIATNLKQQAKARPGEMATDRLPHGAPPEKQVRMNLKFVRTPDGSSEFHLQIQRVGNAPKAGTIQIEKWRRELGTFARDFGAPEDGKWEQQKGETTYAAVLCWKAEAAPAPAPEEPALNPEHTEIIGVLPKPIRIPSMRGDKP